MNEPRIVDRGDGPKIQGTRITVYAIYEYVRHGRSRDWIAATLNLSSHQVEAAIDYIRDNATRILAEYEEIRARVSKGNPPEIESQLRLNRGRVKARLARLAELTSS